MSMDADSDFNRGLNARSLGTSAAPQSFAPPGAAGPRSFAPPSFVARGASPSAIRRAIDARGMATFAAATAAALLVAFVLVFAVWARTRVTAGGYELARLAREHHLLLRERESLTLQLGQLRGAGRLTEAARMLGMGPPPAGRTVVITDAGSAASGAVAEPALVPLLAARP